MNAASVVGISAFKIYKKHFSRRQKWRFNTRKKQQKPPLQANRTPVESLAIC
ncbi:hypothetical protein VIBNISFn27_480068 [Vibrio nigripulchritudo SFn27]|nr:hypothetical protein VIBNIBLFn1_600067 [Vibrio nigripulchritudo BLFn1]CCN88790.1 hypothetical protein VIBNISFn27_480068 [Vibrio nigripulchritudo SFn27]CCO41135.1 hypothetical protein VIBNISFn135_410068 [Vibrio nigripulchritudo SFn135]CCO52452.1 hypothetical protein VIBNIWn13_330068 [Vibrio nigripulchritudo Wn13]